MSNTKATTLPEFAEQWHQYAAANGIPTKGTLFQPRDMTIVADYVPPTYMTYGTGKEAHSIYFSGLLITSGEDEEMTTLRQYYSVTSPPQLSWERWLNPPEAAPAPKHPYLGPRVQGIADECYMNNSGIAYEGSLIRIAEGDFILKPKPGGIGWATMYWFRKV